MNELINFDKEEYQRLGDKWVRTQNKKDLDNLRKFLDHNGIYMTKPKWFYSKEDKSTWKYLDYMTSTYNGRTIVTWLENKHFVPRSI